MHEGAQSLSGRTIGIYEVGSQLGHGGMGTVYRARTTESSAAGDPGSVVALKVFHPELVTDETTFKRFQREAELGMKIRHPNVVRGYEIGSASLGDATYHFMAMEVVEGQTLRDLLMEIGSVPEHLLYQIADQALDALGAVHAENMIHRDVKPENLVLTQDHRVLLMDLGVARLQQEGRDLTRAGEFVGSIAYAAPEQFLDQDHVSPSADLYSFGVVMYELATGRNPFGAAELSTIITQKVKGIVRRPKLVQRDIDPFLDDVILTCLQQDPADRFESCEALRQVLRDADESEWWKGRIAGGAFPAAARALRRLRPPREVRLVGRGGDLDSFHQLFEAARDNGGRVLFLRGASGVGKSRLVHDFAEELVAPDGPVILAGRCSADAERGYLPFLEAVRDLLGDPESLEDRVAELLPDLASVTPAFARFLRGEDTDLESAAIHTTFERLLRNLASGRPVLFIIEDLDRADPESFALFSHLSRSLGDDPALLLATYRREGLEDDSDLVTLVTTSAQRPEVMSIEVEPLGRDAADELIRAYVGQGRTVRALGRQLFQRSDGNPHIILELLAELKNSGALVEQEEGMVLEKPMEGVALPASIRDLFLHRLEEIDETERETLEAAAVQGPSFDASLLAAAMGVKRIRLLKRLAALERKHRLLVSSGKSSFRFASGGLHHVVYDGIEEARRKEIHAQYADAIRASWEDDEEEEAPGPEAVHAAVRHLLAAGKIEDAGDDLKPAVEYAATHHHPARAAAFLEQLLGDLDATLAEHRFDICMRLSSVYEMLARRDARMDALESARAEADRLGGPGPKGRVHAGLAAAFWRAGDYTRAEEEGAKGLELAREAGDREGEAGCLHTLAAVAYRRGEFESCVRFAQQALEIRRETGDRRGEAATLQALGAVMPEVGGNGDALATKQEALAIFREIGDRRGEGGALNNLGNSYVDTHQLDEALVCYEQATKIAREQGDLPSEAAALYNRGRALAVVSRIDEARAAFDVALDLFREMGDPASEAEVLDDLGFAIAQYGEQDLALRHLEKARAFASKTGQRRLLSRTLRHLANLLHTRGDHKKAWRHYEESLALATSRGRVLTRADMGNAALNEGDHDRAVRLLEESLQEREEGSRALLTLCRLARAYKAAGREEDAKNCARRAEAMIEEQGTVAPQYGPEVYYSLGTVFDDGEGARKYLSVANELLGSRTRSIRSVVHRQHYLTMTWPNREILEHAKKLYEG